MNVSKAVLITGCSSGIGWATAGRLADVLIQGVALFGIVAGYFVKETVTHPSMSVSRMETSRAR
jgi:short-subunit dehydrogenase involved in D-alanine esterification of teichoic acids